MTQEPAQDDHEAFGDPEVPDVTEDLPDEERVRTGDERVDSVVAAIERIRDRPVDEHVAAFEQAHDELRRALDQAPPPEPA